MSALFVVPVVDPHRARRLYDSIDPDYRDAYVWVLNCDTDWRPPICHSVLPRGANRGVASAWNIGRALAIGGNHDFMVTVSEALVWGADGGEFFPGWQHRSAAWVGAVHFGWKLQAHSTRMLADVGEFDENFWPAYFEDTDYLYRMGLRGWPSPRENGLTCPYVEVDASLNGDGDAHAIRLVGIEVDLPALELYYARKWGGTQGEETFKRPFGLDDVDDRWWPMPGEQ